MELKTEIFPDYGLLDIPTYELDTYFDINLYIIRK